MCQRKTTGQACGESCAGSVILEGSVNGKYITDSPSYPPHYGPYENGEYETERLSVCTNDHGLFRTHWKNYAVFTLEPRCHLKNSPLLVNAAIDKFNSTHDKGERYKRRRAVVPDVKKLVQENSLQCHLCGRRVSNKQKLDQHMKFHSKN